VVLEMAPARILGLLLSELGLSPDDLAGALGVNRRTVERWRLGESYPQLEARTRLLALLGLNQHLRETFATAEDGRSWFRAGSRYLAGDVPADALRRGEIDRVEAALEALDSGIYL
jgi:transcriptional regulator with XRE-family HTH domain